MKNWVLSWFTGNEKQPELDHERKTLMLTPLDPFSVDFVVLEAGENKNDNRLSTAISAIRSCSKQIQAKIDTQQKIIPKFLSQPKISMPTEDQRKVAVFILIYNRDLKKIKKLQLSLLEKAVFYCDQMTGFVQNVIDHGYPVNVDFSGFLKKINEFISGSPKINRLNDITKIIFKKIYVPSGPIWPTANQLSEEINKVSCLYDTKTKFMKESTFDDMFEKYILKTKPDLNTKYDEILYEMSLFEYTRSLDMLLDLTKAISKEIGFNDFESNEFWIIFYASTRFFFNQVTLQLPYLLSNDLSTSKFIKNCDIIQNKTPKELNAVANVFLPSQLDMKVKSLFTEDSHLCEGLELLKLMQFYNSPLDIASLIDRAISIFNLEITKNFYRNRFNGGNPDCEIPSNVLEGESMIAFDDLFTLFYMGLSIYPPANSSALLMYLKLFGNFTQSQSIDYASTTLQAAVKYICDHFN